MMNATGTNSGLVSPTAISLKSHPALRRVAPTPLLVVFFGGINLILIQWALVREMTALLLGTELVVLLVSVSYFAGLSVGYLLSGRIRQTWLAPLGVATLALHLTLPIWFRLLVVAFNDLSAYWAAFLVLPLLTPFVVSAFYSAFLPLLADTGESPLAKLYGFEILGSGAGVLILVLLSKLGLSVVYSVYSVGLLAILFMLGMRTPRIIILGIAAAAWLLVLPDLNYWSNTLWYMKLHGLPEGTKTLFSGYSPYQKVDVLESPGGGRYLYLDGLSHFSSPDGIRLNIVIGQVPAGLIRPKTALVIGAGVMQTEELIAEYADMVTTVEIDPVVAEVGQQYFIAFNKMDRLTNRQVIVDDAKHFLAKTSERYDLIVTDTPALYSIQSATLYSAPFFKVIGDRLTPGGILAANMTSFFTPDDLVSRRVAASLLSRFKEVMVISPASVGWSFAYAGDHLPFDRRMVEAALRRSGELQFTIFETEAVRAIVGDAPPITLDSLDLVLHTSVDWIGDRLAWR
jgi:spermidine synthase